MSKEDIETDINLGDSFAPPAQADTYESIEGTDGSLKIKHTDKNGVVHYVRVRPEQMDQRFRKLYEEKDFAGVVKKADELLAANPTDRSALFHKAEGHYLLGDHAKAIETYDQIIGMEVNTEQDKKDKATALNNKACSLAATGHEDEAQKLFQEAHGLDPSSPTVAANVAVGYAIKKDYDKAIEYVDKALANGPVDQEQLEMLEGMKEHYTEMKRLQSAGAVVAAGAPDPNGAVG